MHIPYVLSSETLIQVKTFVSIISIITVIFFAYRKIEKPTYFKYIIVSLFIFAIQMINIPTGTGISVNVIGITAAIFLLGTPFGILSTSTVLAVQSILFKDIAFEMLGVNIFNIVLIGSIPGAILYAKSGGRMLKKPFLLFIGTWISVIMSCLFSMVEIRFIITEGYSRVFIATVSAYMLVGIIEGFATVILADLFTTNHLKKHTRLIPEFLICGSLIIGILLSKILGKKLVTGKIAEMYQKYLESAPNFSSTLNIKEIALASDNAISIGIAGLLGLIAAGIMIYGIMRIMKLH